MKKLICALLISSLILTMVNALAVTATQQCPLSSSHFDKSAWIEKNNIQGNLVSVLWNETAFNSSGIISCVYQNSSLIAKFNSPKPLGPYWMTVSPGRLVCRADVKSSDCSF